MVGTAENSTGACAAVLGVRAGLLMSMTADFVICAFSLCFLYILQLKQLTGHGTFNKKATGGHESYPASLGRH